ncbi:MAG: OmpA family protein [Labilithrix sp.]|nr:OmpA family protein [Labilithrix sp.]MBX3221466.1 OmpA family protein [Labilithrix sp.]
MKTSGTLVLTLLLLGGAARTASAQGNGTVTFGGGASTQTGNAGAAGTAAPPQSVERDLLAESVPRDRAADPDKDWAQRESKLNEGITLTGGVGLIHTQHAQGGATGQFRVDFTTEYFSAGFLCTREFPCRDPRNPNNVLQSDSADHIGGRLRLSMQVVKWLDAYLATSALANSNPANRPSLLQVLGDSTLGAKAHGQLSNVFHVGGAFELWLVNGTGSVGLDGAGTSAKFRGLATADLRGAEKPLPLRFSTNLTYVLDNSGEVVAATETARGTPVTRIERYGLNINRVDHFDMHLGAEFFAAEEKVRPFLEYHVLIPVNRQDYRCRPGNPSADKCLATDPFAPSTLTLGSRFYPWKKGFNLTAALDIGISGVGFFIEEMRPTPPWMLYLGAGWAFDTQDKPPVIQERVVDSGRPTGRRIHGFVHEEGRAEGIGGAIVAWENHPELTSLATGTDGRFTTHGLPAGPYVFAVRADGYKPGQCSTTIADSTPVGAPVHTPAAGGGDVQLDCVLQALPRVGNIVGKVKDLDTGLFVGGAAIKVVDVAKKELSGSTDGDGAFRFELVTPGEAAITVDAEGYLVSAEKLDVKVRQDNPIEISVKKKPKNPLVAVQKKEIVIRQQVQFGVDSAVILPASTGLLTEIADVLLKNPRIRHVEVQGHTDGTGAPAHNQRLSEDRASAVVAWLTAHGVASDRLTAKGYGDSKPLVPNVTELNKQRNRRVQFIITEQDAPAAAPSPLGAPALGPPALGAPALGTGAKPPAPKN